MEATMEIKEDGPSLPSNYVTIHDLKQRWLQQKQIPKKSNNDSQLNPKPTTIDDSNDSASNYPNHHHKISPQNPSQPVEKTKKHHRSRYQKLPREPEPEPRQQSNGVAAEVVIVSPPVQKESRNLKSKHKTKTPPSVPRNNGGGGGVTEYVAVGSPVKEQHQAAHKTTTEPFTRMNDDGVAPAVKEQLQSGERSRNQKVFLPKTPPFKAAASNHDAAVEATPVKFRLSRNQKVVRPKSPPFAAVKTVTVTNRTAAAATDDGGGVEVEAVKKMDVSHTRVGYRRMESGLDQRRGWSRSNWYPKPPYRRNTPQMSQVWVKKGESAPSKPLGKNTTQRDEAKGVCS